MRSLPALALAICLIPSVRVASAEDRPPNVVVILVDDLGAVDLGCYGADLHETPNLDRLAASGLRFTSAYASAPVCTPSRAALLTGKHPARLHLTIWREAAHDQPTDRRLLPVQADKNLPHAERTLAEVWRERGYLTAHIGKWHLGESNHYPETQGFDVHIGGTHWGAPATHFFPYRVEGRREPRYVPGLPFGKPGEYLADRLTDEAIEIVRRAGTRPFFLNLWYYGVHTPVEAPESLTEHFRGKLRPGLNHQNPKYAAMVKNLDDNVGRLLAALDELGVAENTIVVFTSDNGGYLGAPENETPVVTCNAPLRSGKGSLYEGGIRVPLIVRSPRVTPAGATCDEPVATADLYRTLIEATGAALQLDAAQESDGQSLLPLLRDPSAKLHRTALFWHYPHYYPTNTPSSAIRDGAWKLIEYFEDQRVELYDLAADPSETRNLADDQPAKAEALRDKLHAWRDQVQAQLPTLNPAGR